MWFHSRVPQKDALHGVESSRRHLGEVSENLSRRRKAGSPRTGVDPGARVGGRKRGSRGMKQLNLCNLPSVREGACKSTIERSGCLAPPNNLAQNVPVPLARLEIA